MRGSANALPATWRSLHREKMQLLEENAGLKKGLYDGGEQWSFGMPSDAPVRWRIFDAPKIAWAVELHSQKP